MQPHTELCAFVCAPKKGYGRPENKGEEIVNCHLITDPDILRLCVEVDGADFQCKVVFDLQEHTLDGDWWFAKLEMVRDWMEAQQVAMLFEPVACCMRRMEVPMMHRMVAKPRLAPPIEVISEKPTKAFVEMIDKLRPELVQDFREPVSPPPKKKPKHSPKREDDGPQLF